MSISQIEKKICFIAKGSLIDSVQQAIPYFSRSTPSTISTRDAQANTEIVRIDAYRPAISPKNGVIGIEPVGKNELTWNANPGNISWVKGTNLSVDLSRKPGLDRTFYTSTLTWRAGANANAQKIRKEILLEANTEYCLSAIFRLTAGLFRATDEIRVVGGVVGTASTSLSVLNKNPQQQTSLLLKFRTTGGNPIIPIISEDYLSIQAVQATAVNVLLPGIIANQLLGAQIKFTGVTNSFLVTGNTATSTTNGIVTLTVASTTTAATLPALGVTVAGKLKISRPPLQQCFVELESRNDVSMEWGAVQIEARAFPTALIFQQDSLHIRSRTELVYPENPIASRPSCGLFVDIDRWQGDGVILTSDAINLDIVNSKLVAVVGGVSMAMTTDLPQATKIFVNIDRISNRALLFVDSKLAGIASLSNFVPPQSTVTLTSEGSRNYRTLVYFEDSLKDSTDLTIGRAATKQVAELFSSRSFGSAAIFRSRRPTFILPQVVIPGIVRPNVVNITGKNDATRTLSLDSIADITINKEVTISNQNIFILKGTVIAIVGNSVILDTPIEIVNVGYQLRQGETTFGKAIARFPWEPIDIQEIASINPIDNSVILQSSALSFSQGKSIVQDSKDRFVCEPLITGVVPIDRKIFVDSIDSLRVGQRISQPRSELNIDPANYLATVVEGNPAVAIDTLAQTGLVLSNGGDQPAEVTISVSVFL
jgi:hypothetical protein